MHNIRRQALEAGLGAAGKDRIHESKGKARDIMKYRKKPVVIEAVQWTGENASEIHGFVGGKLLQVDGEIHIKTLEGVMHATKGDYIIKGVHGEFYPCKPDIFAETYEEVCTP